MGIIDRRAIIGSAVLIFVVGVVFGYLAGDDFSFDRHSYIGGVSYVTEHSRSDVFVDVGVMTACTAYVKEGKSQADGYLSDNDFLSGCRDAYKNLDVVDAIGTSSNLFLPLVPSPVSGTIVPVFCRPHEVKFDEWVIKTWCSVGK
jgi:hypothetical protein